MLRSILYSLLALAMLASPSWSIAQETQAPAEVQEDSAEQAASDQQTEKEGRVFRDRIVVTASRQEEASANTPAPITVIDRTNIEQAQPEKMADLFKRIPGVEVDGEGPFRGLPVIRGFSSNRVLVLVDGQRLNNARESTTFAGIQPGLVNLSEVHRIEVMRGPASVQYGSDAIGGVINIITRRPDLGAEDFTVSGDVRYVYGTSSDSQNASAFVMGSGKGWGFTIGATYQEADDYTAADGASEDSRFSSGVNEDDEVLNSGMEQSSFDASLQFLTGEQGVFRFNAEVIRTDDIGFPGFDASTGVIITFPNFDRDKLGLAWSSGPVWGLQDISLSTYYQTFEKETKFDLSVEVPGFSFSRRSFTHSMIDSIGFNAQSIADAGHHHLTFGLDFYRDQVEDEAFLEECFFVVFCEESTEVAVPKSKQTGIGAYIDDRIAASDRVTIHAGLRGDSFDFKSEDDPNFLPGEDVPPLDVTDSAVSGNLGLTYAITDNVNLNAVVARGFRAPNLQERTFTGEEPNTGLFIVQNPDLDSETSLNYELGFKARYDRYFGGLTVFYNDVEDFITFVELDPDDPDFPDFLDPDEDEAGRFANIAEATIWGIELNLETIFANWWSLFTTVAYLEGENDITKEPLSFVPPFKVIVGLSYQQPRWWAEASVRIVDKQDRLPTDDPRIEQGLPGFTVYDLRAGYDFDFGLGLIASVENLSDKLYAETLNVRPEPGRNLRVSARYRF